MSAGALGDVYLAASDALFLDFDGTLAEIGPDPEAIQLPPGTGAVLGRLAGRLGGAVAVISGRSLRDLAARTPEDLWRCGGHGLEVVAPRAPLPPPLAPPLDAVLGPLRAVAQTPGVRLEVKGPVAAVHYRAAPGAEAACRAAAEAAATAVPGQVVQVGKMVVEVKPEAAHKGRALQRMLALPPFAGRRPVMIGDDTTDEDAIAVAQAAGGVGIHVGTGPSCARFRAEDPAAVRAWLMREAG